MAEWKAKGRATTRMEVPGGWIYSIDSESRGDGSGVCFVPDYGEPEMSELDRMGMSLIGMLPEWAEEACRLSRPKDSVQAKLLKRVIEYQAAVKAADDEVT